MRRVGNRNWSDLELPGMMGFACFFNRKLMEPTRNTYTSLASSHPNTHKIRGGSIQFEPPKPQRGTNG